MTSLRKAFSGSKGKRGLLIAAVVAGSTALTVTTAGAAVVAGSTALKVTAVSPNLVTPPSINYEGCPSKTTVLSTDPFGAFTYVWSSGFSTTHGDGANYHVTLGADGHDVDEGYWSYWC